MAAGDVGLRPPAALGVEGASRVLAVGAGVSEFAVGDWVLAHEAPLPGGSGFWAELGIDKQRLRPAVSAVFELADLAEAFQAQRAARPPGKVVISVDRN